MLIIAVHAVARLMFDLRLCLPTNFQMPDFAHAKQSSDSSKLLIDKMTNSYPEAVLPMALSIGAKVHKGEMKW